MKKPQIHLYLTSELMNQLKHRSMLMGLRPAQYAKFLIVKDVDAHPIHLTLKELAERDRIKRRLEELTGEEIV